MSDIVVRLRWGAEHGTVDGRKKVMHEAADEIERLRRELAKARSKLSRRELL